MPLSRLAKRCAKSVKNFVMLIVNSLAKAFGIDREARAEARRRRAEDLSSEDEASQEEEQEVFEKYDGNSDEEDDQNVIDSNEED